MMVFEVSSMGGYLACAAFFCMLNNCNFIRLLLRLLQLVSANSCWLVHKKAFL